LGLTGGAPRFRLDGQADDDTWSVEIVVAGHWDAAALLDRVPHLRRRGIGLALDTLDADEQSVRVHVSTPMHLVYEGAWDSSGLGLDDILTLPDAQAELVAWMLRRREVRLDEVAAHSGADEKTARALLDGLVERGIVGELQGDGGSHYAVRMAARRGRVLPRGIWAALEEDGAAPAPADPPARATYTWAQRVRESLVSGRGRFLLAIS